MRAAAAGATLKTIISAGELGTLENVYKSSLIAMAAGEIAFFLSIKERCL